MKLELQLWQDYIYLSVSSDINKLIHLFCETITIYLIAPCMFQFSSRINNYGINIKWINFLVLVEAKNKIMNKIVLKN